MNEIDIESINNLLEAKDARIRELEAENAIQREREIALAKASAETFNATIEALRTIKPGKETTAFFVDSCKRIEAARPEDRPFVALARANAAAAMIRDSPPAPVMVEGQARFTYTLRGRTENRALALVDHARATGKASLKSTEARLVLEEREGQALDRKVVHRALEVAQGLLRASRDMVGGVVRLVIPSTAHAPDDHHEDSSSVCVCGGPLSRPRGDRPPWDK